MTLLRSLLVQLKRSALVLGHTVAKRIQVAQIHLATGAALLGGFGEPLEGATIILDQTAATISVKFSQTILCMRFARLGSTGI